MSDPSTAPAAPQLIVQTQADASVLSSLTPGYGKASSGIAVQQSATVTMRDMATTVSSAVETRILARLAAERKALSEAQTVLNQAIKDFDATLTNEPDVLVANQNASLFPVPLTTIVSSLSAFTGKGLRSLTDSPTFAAVKNRISFSVKIVDAGNNTILTRAFSDVTPVTDLKGAHDNIQALTARVETIQRTISMLQAGLANLPALERAAQAKITTSLLNESAEGKAIVDRLAENFDADQAAADICGV